MCSLYSALCTRGYLGKDLYTYGEDFSPFKNHISHHVRGVEFSTGALGHGLSVACGLAKAAKISSQTWHTFVILSDGEMQEGSNWEALMFAPYHNLNNLTIFIDSIIFKALILLRRR